MSDASLDEQLLSALLDGELDAEQQDRASRLLAENPEYAKLVQDWREQREQLQELPRYKLDTGFADRVLEKAARQRQPTVKSPSRPVSSAGSNGSVSSTITVSQWRFAAAAIVSLAAMLLLTLFIFPPEFTAPDVAVMSKSEMALQDKSADDEMAIGSNQTQLGAVVEDELEQLAEADAPTRGGEMDKSGSTFGKRGAVARRSGSEADADQAIARELAKDAMSKDLADIAAGGVFKKSEGDQPAAGFESNAQSSDPLAAGGIGGGGGLADASKADNANRRQLKLGQPSSLRDKVAEAETSDRSRSDDEVRRRAINGQRAEDAKLVDEKMQAAIVAKGGVFGGQGGQRAPTPPQSAQLQASENPGVWIEQQTIGKNISNTLNFAADPVDVVCIEMQGGNEQIGIVQKALKDNRIAIQLDEVTKENQNLTSESAAQFGGRPATGTNRLPKQESHLQAYWVVSSNSQMQGAITQLSEQANIDAFQIDHRFAQQMREQQLFYGLQNQRLNQPQQPRPRDQIAEGKQEETSEADAMPMVAEGAAADAPAGQTAAGAELKRMESDDSGQPQAVEGFAPRALAQQMTRKLEFRNRAVRTVNQPMGREAGISQETREDLDKAADELIAAQNRNERRGWDQGRSQQKAGRDRQPNRAEMVQELPTRFQYKANQAVDPDFQKQLDAYFRNDAPQQELAQQQMRQFLLLIRLAPDSSEGPTISPPAPESDR